MRSCLAMLLVVAACRDAAPPAAAFGCEIAETQEAGLDDRRRMVWGLDSGGGVTWTRTYDARVTAAIELDLVPDAAGTELVVATGRFSLGRARDAGQLIVLDRYGVERARCTPARAFPPPESSHDPLDTVHLRRSISHGRLVAGRCRGENVVLCGVTGTSGWCLAAAFRYENGRLVPIAGLWNRGTIQPALAISDEWMGAAVLTGRRAPEPGRPQPVTLSFTRVDRTRPDAVWSEAIPSFGSGRLPNRCVSLSARGDSFEAVIRDEPDGPLHTVVVSPPPAGSTANKSRD